MERVLRGNVFGRVDAESGALFDCGDAAGLADALASLLGDEARRASLSRRGRARAEKRFRLSSVVDQTLRVYEEAIRDAA